VRSPFAKGVAAILAILTLAAGALAESPATPRASRLRHGINTSHWFAQVYSKLGHTPEHYTTHTTEADIETIAELGFDHVRLSVDPAPALDEKRPAEIPAAYLGQLDRAIAMILARRLAVVVDVHPASEFKKRLEADNAAVDAFATWWRALARHLARYPADALFLEILNEPEFADPYRWMGVQARLAAAIREGAPEHTIIATGHEWSAVYRLVEMEPLRDPNVIYTFHFYEPHLFTHQGATWGSREWPHVRDLVYPSSPPAVAPTVARVEDAGAKGAVEEYGRRGWNAAVVAEEIALAARWARKHGVPIVCNEFGVYRRFTPVESRLAWLRDVRTALEVHGIGWTMWDYAGSFGVVTKADGRTTVDTKTVDALGLRPRRR
jgi:aryl-phospho-beta-D-glucosidase BglC (GH1 family)